MSTETVTTNEFVVNGSRWTYTLPPGTCLGAIKAEALAQTHNMGRPRLEDWEFRDVGGHLLREDVPWEALGIPAGKPVFLSLTCGGGDFAERVRNTVGYQEPIVAFRNEPPRWVRAGGAHGLLVGDIIVAWVIPRFSRDRAARGDFPVVGYSWSADGSFDCPSQYHIPKYTDTLEEAKAAAEQVFHAVDQVVVGGT